MQYITRHIFQHLLSRRVVRIGVLIVSVTLTCGTVWAAANDFPHITVVYTTSALDIYSVPHAVARAQLAATVRAEYASTGRVFDLATIESTAPDGSRIGGTSGGQPYYQPYSGYLQDGGHLNATGAEVADTKLFKLLASL